MNKVLRMVPRIGLVALAVTLTACASGPQSVGTRDLLDVVKPGAPRAELVLTLGPPFATFEGERIMAWPIGQDTGGYFVGNRHDNPYAFTRHELVVVFDADGKVVKHSLVEVHKP
jgi:outer membrane protein assembly factor BamE (lipoprotein component of BamABCDE complex)